MKNLTELITQGEWEIKCGAIFSNIRDRPIAIFSDEIDSKAISQIPTLLGLVDVLYQRYTAKIDGREAIDVLTVAELHEYYACVKVKEAVV